MKVNKESEYLLSVSSSDIDLLNVIKEQTDGYKIRNQGKILLPVKSGSKILNFKNYGIEYGDGAEEEINTVIYNIEKRKQNVVKIKSQYGHDIKFNYEVKGVYPPLEHQKIMFNMVVYNNAAAILAEPGTCKTGAYLWAIDKRMQMGQVKKTLIITLNSLKKNVVAESLIQVPHLKCVVLDGKDNSDKILNKTWKQSVKNIDYDIYVGNYESAFSLVELFPDDYFDMVILDEAHRIGSSRSRQTRAIVSKFENTKYKYICSGTLSSNNELSFFMPYRFLGPDTVPYAKFEEFRRKYFYSVDPDQYIWVPCAGTKTAVKNIIGDIGAFFAKEECLNLPEIIYQKYECDMSSEHAKVYEDMKTNLIASIDDMCGKCDKKGKCDNSCDQTISTKTALTLITKLSQLACGFYLNTAIKIDDNGHETQEQNIIDFTDNAKIKLLIETINNIPADKKIIIWSQFTHSIDIIAYALTKANLGGFLKLYKDIDAFETVEKFKELKYRFLLSNHSKGGVGLNIQFSSYQIFFSNDFSYIKRKQCLGRQDRAGQKNNVTAIDLLCKNTIDGVILKRLDYKEELSDELVSLAHIKKLLK